MKIVTLEVALNYASIDGTSGRFYSFWLTVAGVEVGGSVERLVRTGDSLEAHAAAAFRQIIAEMQS